jgi:hypothetical protein
MGNKTQVFRVRFYLILIIFLVSSQIHAAETILQKSETGKVLISPNGRYILYGVLQTDQYNKYDFAIKDLWTGNETLGAINGAYIYGNFDSIGITNDGNKIIFVTWNGFLAPGEAGGLFIKDLNLNITRRIDVQADSSIIPNSGGWSFSSSDISISGDGASVTFAKRVYTDGTWSGGQSVNIYKKSLTDETLQMIDSSTSGSFISGYSSSPSVNSDGSKVVFTSYKNGLVSGDNDNQEDIFLKNLLTGSIYRLNTQDGTRFGSAGYSWSAKITPNGQFVIFSSGENLASNSVVGKNNLYKINLLNSEMECISSSDTYQGGAFYPAVSDTKIVFQSQDWSYEPTVGKSIVYSYSYDINLKTITRFPSIQPLELPSAFDVNILAGETSLSENGKTASFWTWARWLESDTQNSGHYYGIQLELNNPPSNFDRNNDGITDAMAVSLGYNPALNLTPLINYLKSNPVSGLYNQNQYDSNRTAGQNDILNNPNSHNLFTSNQIHNIGLGGIVLNRDTNNQLTLNTQVMQSTDLQNWTPYQTIALPITNAPANKLFLRVQAVGQ